MAAPGLPMTPADLAAADRHLAADPVLAPLVAQYGPCALRPASDRLAALVGSIISQQISVRAAASILARFRTLLPDGPLDAAAITALPTETVRSAGLSGAKAAAIHDLAARVADGRLDLDALDTLDNEAAIAALLPVRGVGRWTAEMYLIFALARPDVLPVGDLGLRRAAQLRYGLPDLADPPTLERLAAPWQPYRSVATWYLWRSLSSNPPVF
ncbi:MAG TPA: DNA-3-methyladenine glycosylase 2 family protein [Chloroflexia bacterium]|nr:DNA-3-methyladenine glycosylase 2 family protein [Chloroflexia bacterium]